jgi:hypothetical protein
MNVREGAKPLGVASAVIDRIKRNLVSLKMPRALEILDAKSILGILRVI